MAYRPMSKNEIVAFLSRTPARPGVLATVRADGRPHAAPIWYDLDEPSPDDPAGNPVIVFTTDAATVKGRNLTRDPRLSIVVQDDRPPFSFVTLEGRASLSDDLDEVRRWAARLGGRYMGSDRAEEFGARNGVPGELLVRVTVRHATSARDVAG